MIILYFTCFPKFSHNLWKNSNNFIIKQISILYVVYSRLCCRVWCWLKWSNMTFFVTFSSSSFRSPLAKASFIIRSASSDLFSFTMTAV